MLFRATHRVLIKAHTGDHSYELYEIDVNNGGFKRSKVMQQETSIRVRDKVLAEILGKRNTGLTINEALELEKEFNAIRTTKGFNSVKFERLYQKDENEK